MGELKIEINSFSNDGMIPEKFTCKGEDISPEMVISGIPSAAKSLALIVDDPDAAVGTWVHWVVWNIPLVEKISEGALPSGAVQGINDFRKHDYGGPCPPSGTHRYFFKLYALDKMLGIDEDSGKEELEDAMKGHIIAQTQVVGLFGR